MVSLRELQPVPRKKCFLNLLEESLEINSFFSLREINWLFLDLIDLNAPDN